MINQSNFFDLYDVGVNELVGDVTLFIILGMVVITFLSVKYKMPYQMTILFNLLFLAILFAETKILIIWVFIVLIVGLLFYYGMSKTIKR